MTDTATETPRLYRGRDRLLSGVGSGLARHLGIDPVVTRLALLVLGIAGIGIAVYLVLTFFVPVEPEPADAASGAGAGAADDERTRKKGRDLGQLFAYLALAGGFGVLFLVFGGVFDPLLWFLEIGRAHV